MSRYSPSVQPRSKPTRNPQPNQSKSFSIQRSHQQGALSKSKLMLGCAIAKSGEVDSPPHREIPLEPRATSPEGENGVRLKVTFCLVPKISTIPRFAARRKDKSEDESDLQATPPDTQPQNWSSPQICSEKVRQSPKTKSHLQATPPDTQPQKRSSKGDEPPTLD
jgi:hypothetical protein